VAEINKRTDDEAEGRQRRRRGEVFDHNVVSSEVQGRDDDLKGDGLGQRLSDRKTDGGDQWSGRGKIVLGFLLQSLSETGC
jgi:hypothetical protein